MNSSTPSSSGGSASDVPLSRHTAASGRSARRTGKKLDAVALSHVQVEQDDVDGLRRDELLRAIDGLRLEHAVVLELEVDAAEHAAATRRPRRRARSLVDCVVTDISALPMVDKTLKTH